MKSSGIPSRTYMDRTGRLTVWPGGRPLPATINPRGERRRLRDLRMSQRRMVSLWLLALLLIGVLVMGNAQAMTVSYVLNQSNALAVNQDYLKVTLDDEGLPGAINVTVEALPGLSTGDRFGLQGFGINGAMLSGDNIVLYGDAGGWRVRNNVNLSEFGRFDLMLAGTGNARVSTLSFSIIGVDGDSPLTYASSSQSSNGIFFAAHVAGLNIDYGVTSAWIGGSTPVPPLAVSLPASSGLFGIGILTLVGMSGRSGTRERIKEMPRI